MSRTVLFSLSFFCLAAVVLCQTCTGSQSGTFADVTVNGGACTLNGATVTGSVMVLNGGSLTTLGTTTILGSVSGDGSADILLSGTTTVNGLVSSTNSPTSTLTIDTSSSIGSVSMLSSGNAVIKGSITGISSASSKDISVDGGTIGGGGVFVSKGSGDISLCSATVSGAVTISENVGDLLATVSPPCTASSITGTVSVEKGTGNVDLSGATVSSGDVLVVDQTGNVVISSSTISDIAITNLDGSITLDGVQTDSDATISGTSGLLKVMNSNFVGDAAFRNGAGVEVSGSSFSLEVVVIENNSGPVTFDSNVDLSVTVTVNDDVTISNNVGRVASVTKNTGGVSISGNTFTELSCVDNNPAPTGSGNTVTSLASGQCSSF